VNDLVHTLAYTAAVLLAVIVGLALYAWREVRRNDQLVDELDRAHQEIAAIAEARDTAKYRAARLETRLARLERDQLTRTRRAGYIDMPTVNGKRVL
jgi:hypothetical protein